jgi:2-polyprenyl-6-methoxyphenol hydroxylase-like FAD-dependent oxidoreductase
MSDASETVDVLVVGAGPTGLMMASELLRHGLRVRLVDAEDRRCEQSRAIAVHARTLEILDDVGVGQSIVDAGKKLVGATLWAGGAEPVVRLDFDELPSRHRYVVSIAQAETERILGELLEKRGGAIERQTSLVSYRQDGTGVTATLKAPSGETSCRAAWLVGCDGAHSVTRKTMGVAFDGETYDESLFLADVKIAWDVRDDRISTWFGDDGLVACFPLPGGRFRVVGTIPAHDERKEPPSLEVIQTMVRMLSGLPAEVTDATWLARFRVHCRQVAHYRDDRVFLAGDAAHIHSPAGGQGMNTGIQDAHNLAWKLALVHRGDARGRLLDSYETERHAVGKRILASTDAATKVGLIRSAPVRGTRNQIARFLTSFESVQHRIAATLSELSIAYDGSPIVREDVTGLLNARIGTAAGGETPTLASVREFSAGPAAGHRAPDGKVTRAGEGGTQRLMETLDSRKHTALLFDGRSASSDGYARMNAVAAAITGRFGASIDVKVITPRSSRPEGLAKDLTVLLDPDGELEKAYAASTECLYVIRPDLWVGYRSQPIAEEQVLAWLGSFLR